MAAPLKDELDLRNRGVQGRACIVYIGGPEGCARSSQQAETRWQGLGGQDKAARLRRKGQGDKGEAAMAG